MSFIVDGKELALSRERGKAALITFKMRQLKWNRSRKVFSNQRLKSGLWEDWITGRVLGTMSVIVKLDKVCLMSKPDGTIIELLIIVIMIVSFSRAFWHSYAYFLFGINGNSLWNHLTWTFWQWEKYFDFKMLRFHNFSFVTRSHDSNLNFKITLNLPIDHKTPDYPDHAFAYFKMTFI